MRPATANNNGGRYGSGAPSAGRGVATGNPRPLELLAEVEFRRSIQREKARTERSGNPFILLLVDTGGLLIERPKSLPALLTALAQSTRDTDFVGWFEAGTVLAVIYTEVSRLSVVEQGGMLVSRTREALGRALTVPVSDRIGLSIHVFPEEGEGGAGLGPVRIGSPMDADDGADSKAGALLVKRCMDIAGSFLALVVFSPVLIAVAIAVKLTSNGPVLFKQQRVGLRGQTFTFIKFRSMKTDNDPAIHQAYVEQFITAAAPAAEENAKPVYKIVNDPRVTPVGQFLRRTSLDEFPQFYNVLKGDMALVGPRPPIPYEVNRYDTWHKRRYLSVKPGLTGLWQVHGRSRTTFDEMVRLDLLYARSWTIWGDIKILLQTPCAVIGGDGAR